MAQRIETPGADPGSSDWRDGEDPTEVRRQLEAIRRSRWLIAAIVVLLTIIVVVVSASLPNRYRATASIVMNVTTDPLATTDVNIVKVEHATIARLLTSTDVLAAAARTVPGETEHSLRDNVSSNPNPDGNIITVTATAGAAGRAAQIANAVAHAFVSLQALEERAQLTADRAGLLQEEARVKDQPGAALQLQAIEQRLSQLGLSLAAIRTNLEIAQPATAPDSPASPKPVRNGIIAVFLGLFVGILVALGRDQVRARAPR